MNERYSFGIPDPKEQAKYMRSFREIAPWMYPTMRERILQILLSLLIIGIGLLILYFVSYFIISFSVGFITFFALSEIWSRC